MEPPPNTEELQSISMNGSNSFEVIDGVDINNTETEIEIITTQQPTDNGEPSIFESEPNKITSELNTGSTPKTPPQNQIIKTTNKLSLWSWINNNCYQPFYLVSEFFIPNSQNEFS